MKPPKTKAQIRAEIEKQIEKYISSGGTVNDVPTGLSGCTTNENIFANTTTFEPKKDRTPLTEVVKTLEERKKSKGHQPIKRNLKPSKKLITDDFGEPLRWVWTDKN